MARLFVAIRLPDPFKAAVRRLQCGLSDVRWLNADGLHLTLAFIGDANDSTQQRIEDGLNTVSAPEFSMKLSGLGRFPPRGAPRVLWAGVEPKAEATALAEAVQGALGQVGLAMGRRAFLPHVTIARFRQRPPPAELARFLAANERFRTGRANVNAFHLFSSKLQAHGALYTIEKTIPLRVAPSENAVSVHRNPAQGRNSTEEPRKRRHAACARNSMK